MDSMIKGCSVTMTYIRNYSNPFAVLVCKGTMVVGHVPRKISAVCYLGKTGSTITGMVTGLRRYSPDLPQGGDSGCMLDSMDNKVCW